MLTAVVTVAVVLLVLLATALVARSMVNPLRRLQTDALEIASVRLPARVAAAASGTDLAEADPASFGYVEPIGVQGTDEIARVARAFDQVHAEAVRLAGTEAQLRSNLNTMFISLSRRSVPLIDRLSRMIDNLEQNEADSEQLSHLFSMDHLVTRMRRNSENLLVLAGEEPVRKWSEPVPLGDVARAASAEIEQYGRVALTVQPGIMVSGQAAADIVHLLAELIENATLFSPRENQIQVSVGDSPGGGVLVEVRDEGVGVSAARLDGDELAARPPARRRRVGVAAHGPVRGLPAGGAARHQGQAPRGQPAGPDRPGLAAGQPDQPRAAAGGRHALAPAPRGQHVQRDHGVR